MVVNLKLIDNFRRHFFSMLEDDTGVFYSLGYPSLPTMHCYYSEAGMCLVCGAILSFMSYFMC